MEALSDTDRDLLRRSIRELLGQRWPAEGAVERAGEPQAVTAVWRGLAGQGLGALGADSAEAGLREIALVFEELGRAACPAPLLGVSSGTGVFERNTFNSSQDLHVFFDVAVQVCDYFLGKTQARLAAAHGKVRELDTKKAVEVAKLADLAEHGLARERRRFLEKWNNPFTNLTAPIETEVRYPDEDPLSKFLADISGHGDAASAPVETYFFAPTPDGFYNQNGLSLRDFMKARAAGDLGRDAICVFPVFDPEGRISGEMVKAVRNPVASSKPPALPTIKFVESYPQTVTGKIQKYKIREEAMRELGLKPQETA